MTHTPELWRQLGAMFDQHETWHAVIAYMKSLETKNADLLAALEGFVEHAYDEDTEQRIYWENEARAAIAKVRQS